MNERENLNAPECATLCCDECGQCDVELFDVDGRMLCAECLESLGYVRCTECGEWHEASEVHDYDGGMICESCAESKGLELCDRCGAYSRPRNMVEVLGDWRHDNMQVCSACLDEMLDRDEAFYCDDCGNYYLSRYMDRCYPGNGDTICEGCREDHYSYCSECDELYHNDDLWWDEDNDEYLCPTCHRNRERRPRYIHDYGFKPYPVFHGTVDDPCFGDPLTFGFEDEVDKGHARDDCAAELYNTFGEDQLYMKNDSSVDFEIVTHPRTLKSYLEDFDFDRMCQIPVDFGFKSHDAGTCGFHIHVGRTQLGRTNADRNFVISKIVLLMWKHWNSLVKFSRRTDSQLSHWAAAPKLTFKPDHIAYDQANLLDTVRRQYIDEFDRYRALNLCNNGTIEFRLWRGSLKPVTLKATLQLTSNLCRFAMDNTLEDVVKSTWEDLVNYETCPELTEYIASLHLEDGLETKEIPFNNELPAEKACATQFSIGDRVRIIKGNHLVSDRMIGAVGTIRGVKVTDFDEIEYAVEIDDDYPHDIRVTLHWCEGLVPNDRGYWVNPETIEPENPVFTVGQRVCYEPNGFAPDDAPNRTGIVIRPADTRNGLVGVSLDGFTGGHDLDGHMPLTRDQRSGWYFVSSVLRPASSM